MTNIFSQIYIDGLFSSLAIVYAKKQCYTDITTNNNTLMLTNILASFDLTDKEIDVFNKVLDLGAQPASHIARVLEMPRNTVRSILDGLVKKNLLIKTNRANTQYYSVESKKNMIRYLKHKKVKMAEKMEDQIMLLEQYWDEIDLKHKSKARPKITFYEWLDWLEKVYEDTLTARDGIKSWASYQDMYENFDDYFKTYFKRRSKKNITISAINPDVKEAKERQKHDKEELRDSALIPKDKFSWWPEIQVYNDKVNIASWKEKLGVIIESPEIAEAMKMIFDLSFEAAKAYSKKK